MDETLPSLEMWDRKIPLLQQEPRQHQALLSIPRSPILQEAIRASRQGLGLIKESNCYLTDVKH